MAGEGSRPSRPIGSRNDPIPMRRLKAKLGVLRGWLRHGVPADKFDNLPRSLAQAFAWEDVELGLEAKGSYKDFVMTHPVYGSTVRAVRDAIVELRKVSSSPNVAPLFPITNGKRGVSAAVPSELIAVVSQWHAERQKAEDLRVQFLDADHKRSLAEDDVARLEAEVRGLRQRISAAEPARLASSTGEKSLRSEMEDPLWRRRQKRGDVFTEENAIDDN